MQKIIAQLLFGGEEDLDNECAHWLVTGEMSEESRNSA
jgi:hypothetical protein